MSVAHVGLLAALVLLLTVPGLLALRAAGHASRGVERLALAVGCSVALWPLALWGTTLLGLAWRWWAVRLVVSLIVGGLLLFHVRDRGRARPSARPSGRAWTRDPWSVATVALMLLAAGQRAWQARDLVVAPWVDGLHHTMIAQLIVRGGQVPTDFAPYLEQVPFYYHFGFHALAAAASLLSGVAAPEAVLWTGQALNVATVPVTWLLARRLTGSRVAATVAASVPAAWHYFPAYYLTWGRYTQLAGLVALPAAWALLDDARRGRGGMRVLLLAGVIAGAMPLVHYRVTVFFALGALVLTADARAGWRGRLARMALVSGLALAVAAPWLGGPLHDGVRGIANVQAPAAPLEGEHVVAGDASAVTSVRDDEPWYGWDAAVDALPAWPFTIHLNTWLMALAAFGLVIGLMARWRGADALAAWLTLAVVVVHPRWLGLGSSWLLPRFALVISLWLPVALGIALLARAAAWLGLRMARRRTPRWRRGAHGLAAAAVVATACVGAWSLREIVNPVTVIVQPGDVAAQRWVHEHTPAGARFLVPTGHWHLGTYRGLDGGYWLPVLAERSTTIPASFYVYGNPDRVREVTALAQEVSRAAALDDDGLLALLRRGQARWIYVGPASRGHDDALERERLRRHPALVERYAEQGVAIFEWVP